MYLLSRKNNVLRAYIGIRRHGNSVNHGDVIMMQLSCPRDTRWRHQLHPNLLTTKRSPANHLKL